MMNQYPYYVLIADAIQEVGTFDLQEDTGGWPKIHWIIANHMLRDYTDADRHRLLDSTVGKIERNLTIAIDHLQESRNIPVYKIICNGKGENKKNIDCITIDPEYRDAKLFNYDRLRKRVNTGLNSFMKQVEITFPERLPELEKGQHSFEQLMEMN